MPPRQALSAAAVGLHHLRLLQHIEGLASREPGAREVTRRFVSESQTRLSLARLSAQTYSPWTQVLVLCGSTT